MFQLLSLSLGDLVLIATIIIAGFMKEPWQKALTVVFFALMVKFRPGIDVENLLFLGSGFMAIGLPAVLPFEKNAGKVISGIAAFIIWKILFIFL